MFLTTMDLNKRKVKNGFVVESFKHKCEREVVEPKEKKRRNL